MFQLYYCCSSFEIPNSSLFTNIHLYHILSTHSSNNYISTSFEDGEPNDGGWLGNEDCVEMRENFNFNWNDEGCGSKNRYGARSPALVFCYNQSGAYCYYGV